jgi:diaminopimelate epimerase
MQGTGNDFVVVETNDTGCDWSQLAVAVCDRHYGIGADGLLLLMPSAQDDFRMRIFNADGSEANTCGNGIRCLVKYYLDFKYPKKTGNKVSVETLIGIREAHVRRSSGRVTGVTIGMGRPKSGKNGSLLTLAPPGGNIVDIMSSIQYTLPLKEVVLSLDLVSIGNAHAVYFTEKPVIEFPLSEIGPEVERHFLPEGMNFEVARLIGDKLIEMRVWEHGVGETLACGSGACATTVAARLHDYVGNTAMVSLPGGNLEIQWDGIGEVFLSGPSEFVFAGEWPDIVHNKGKGVAINNEVLA